MAQAKLTSKRVIGILREAHNNWERRVPLTPSHVRQLVSKGVNVLLQPSGLRIFANEQYTDAGATLTDNMESADVILGVKQAPKLHLLPNKTYMFFSHTIKAVGQV